jgi:holo-[acyl-carrier protein] synthase
VTQEDPSVVEEVAQQPSRNHSAIEGALPNAVGVGVDVVGITAFAEQLDEPGTRFARSFTPGERRAARAGSDGDSFREAESLAARWAAKEAVIKAWSSTCFGHPEVIDPTYVDLREIEVRTDAWGRPAIRLHGEIAESMAGYTVLVSLTHDSAADVAAAFVVLQEQPSA